MTLLKARIERCGYPGGFEIRDVDLEVDHGEVWLITGISGSGKSTLVRAITGTIEYAGGYLKGEVLVAGRDISEMKPEELHEILAYIPQEPWYAIIGHTVHSEICHSLASIGINCTDIDFSPLGVGKLIERLTYTLSAGEVLRVLWLETILKEAKLIILDEPLVYLDQDAKLITRQYVKQSLSKNSAVIIVDHDPLRWEFIKPNIVLMDNGRVRYKGPWSNDVVKDVKISLEHIERSSEREKGVFARFKNVYFRYPGGGFILSNFSMNIHRENITAITGPNGSGKTTILKLASGVLKPIKGIIERYGTAIYIPENPLLYFTKPTPREELLYASRGDENKVLDTADLFNIRHVLDRPLAKLSSGERRRIAVASAYLYDFDGYFIDEPTGGLDDLNTRLIIDALGSLVENGKAITIASHDERIVKTADYVIDLGKI